MQQSLKIEFEKQTAADSPNASRNVLPSRSLTARIASLIILLLLTVSPNAFGQYKLSLAWDRSASASVAGYRLYYGPKPGNYTNWVDVGNVLTGTISNLVGGATYYVAATAYDDAQIESEFSNEVSWTIAQNTKPAISDIAYQMITVNGTTPTLAFTVSDSQTAASNLVVTARSSNTTLLPTSRITLGGTGASRTVVAKPATGQVGQATVTLTVSDGELVSSSSFVLTVNPLPTIVLTAPRSGTTLMSPASFKLAASVTTNGNLIQSVRFYRSTTLLGQDALPPYEYNQSALPAGSYTFTARVIYNGGKSRASSQVSVTVTNAAGLQLASSSASITAPFTLSSGLISQSVNTSLSNAGKAVFPFSTAETTNYVVYADVLAPSAAANSFFVNIDQEPEDPVMIWDLPISASITNSPVAWRGGGAENSNQYSPKVFSLPAGNHQLIFRGKEANTKLGGIQLTPVSGLVAPWRTTTVGSGLASGVGSISGGDSSLLGAGVISGSSDRFALLYQSLSGDGEIVGKFLALSSTSAGARTGIMVRESLTSGSKYVLVSKAGDGSVRWQKRETTSSGTVNVQVNSTNSWFRILRRGNTLTGYTSPDGRAWYTLGVSTNVMATNIYMGLVMASGTTNDLASGSFSQVRAVP